MPRPWLLLSIVFAPAALGCTPDIPEGRFACVTDEDCPPELVCRTNVSRCYSTRGDAPPDAGE